MAKYSAIRLGIERGLIEFKILIKDPQTLVWAAIMTTIFLVVLWFQKGANIDGVSLALLTLPSLLGMQIASSGFSDVASGISFDKEDGTLLRAKAIPGGISAYFISRVIMTFVMTLVYLVILLVPSLFIVPGLLENVSFTDGGLFLLFVVLGLFATAPLGAVIGSIVKSSSSGWGLSLLPLLILGAISGIFYPITALAGWIQVIAQIFPVYWLGLGFRSIFSPEAAAALEIGGTWRTGEAIAVLVAWMVVGFIIAPRIIKKMTRKVSGGEMEEARQRTIQRGY
jgi:ABC-2 type transport system permease protein